MPRRRSFLAAALLAMLPAMLAAMLPRAWAAEPARLVLGTATPGGGFPAYGEALAAAVAEVDPALILELRPTKGSTENFALLKAGALDLALVQGEYAYEALSVAGDRAALPTVVAPIDAAPGLFVVPAASPVRRIADLQGRPVALGTHSSGLTVMGRLVLRGSGLDPERDIRPVLLDRAGDGPAMLRDGRADALWGGGVGWPGFRTMAAEPGGARFFGPEPGAIPAILALSPSLRRMRVPAGTFGQAEAIETVGSWSFILARPGLEPAAVTRLVRAIAAGREGLARRFVLGAGSDPRNLVEAVPAAWLHPATAAFLGEAGRAPQ